MESTLGQGSSFRFAVSLPEVNGEDSSALGTARRIVGVHGEAPTLLIVDDHQESRRTLSELLRPLGFEIFEASDGHEALEKVRNSQPKAIITDIMMPGMDGLEFIRQIRQVPEFHETVILASSARVYEEDRQRCLAAGSDDFLPKPIQLDTLFHLLQKHLHLEWVYETDTPVAQQLDTSAIPAKLPTPEIIEALLKASVLGDILALRKQLDTLENTDAALHSFVTSLRQLTQRYQVLEIRNFLESCREQHRRNTQLQDAHAQIATLPPEQLNALKRAATCNDITLMQRLIEELRPKHPALAGVLGKLAYNFDYKNILELVKQGKE